MRKTKKQPSFFEETDLLRGNSCSLFAIISVLVLIFLVFTIILIITKMSGSGSEINIPLVDKSAQSTQPVVKKIADLKADEKIEMRIDQSELTTLIQAVPDFPLKKPQAEINPNNIVLSGKTGNNILSLTVQVYLKPTLSEGKLGWEIESIKTGGVIAPKSISEKVSKKLLPGNFLPGREDIIVERADLFDSYLLIIGVKK